MMLSSSIHSVSPDTGECSPGRWWECSRDSKWKCWNTFKLNVNLFWCELQTTCTPTLLNHTIFAVVCLCVIHGWYWAVITYLRAKVEQIPQMCLIYGSECSGSAVIIQLSVCVYMRRLRVKQQLRLLDTFISPFSLQTDRLTPAAAHDSLVWDMNIHH